MGLSKRSDDLEEIDLNVKRSRANSGGRFELEICFLGMFEEN